VTQPVVANTAPQVSVTGVTDGQEYRTSSVPTAGCSVLDAEDTNESAAPNVTNGAYNALGSHTVTCSYTDGGGLSDSDSVTYTVIRDLDTTAPVISYTLTPAVADSLSGWYTGDVALAWTVTENESPETLNKIGCVDQTVSADQSLTSYSCSASSEGGRAQETVSLKRDGTAPTVSYASESGTSGTNGWYTSDVAVTFTATDATSGPATSSQTVTSSGQGTAVTVDSPAFSDNAGNTTAAGAVTKSYKIDKSAPNAPTATLNPAPNGAGWNKADVVVSFTAADDNGPSGVASCTANVMVSAETDGRTVSGTCTDKAGNVSAATAVTVKLDRTGPSISEVVTEAGTKGANEWYTSDVVVTFTATDSLSGPATATKTVTSSGQGTAVTVDSPAFTDTADNTTTAGAVKKTYKIDRTAPTGISFTGGPAEGGSYYFGYEPAAPTCDASDAVSGLASCEVSGGGSSVGTHTYTATATDNAGNTATEALQYTVLAWTTKGYYSPVDMGEVWNTVKGGSTVPLKFELFAGSTELTSTSAVKSYTAKAVACPGSGATVDPIVTVLTGGTMLRYDTTGGQFIQNWQTPKKPGTCYRSRTPSTRWRRHGSGQTSPSTVRLASAE